MSESLVLGIAGMAVGGFVTFLVSRHYYKKDRKDMATDLEKTIDRITTNIVDAANAAQRVGEKGGQVKYRNHKKIGVEQSREINEKVNISKNVNAVLNPDTENKKIISQHEVNHSTDSYLAKSEEDSKS